MRFAIVATAALALASPAFAQSEPVLDQAEIERIVRETIMANPEIVTDALRELDRRAEAEQAAQQAEAVAQYQEQLVASPHDMVLGNPEGSVTLVEFFDYNCSFCRSAMKDVQDLIDTVPELRVVMKEYPVLGTASVEAARVSAAVTAVAPEKYDAFHEALLGSRERADEATALAVAEGLGADMDAIRAAMEKPETVRGVLEARELGRALGINGTPSYVVGDRMVIGAQGYDVLRAAIEDEMREDG